MATPELVGGSYLTASAPHYHGGNIWFQEQGTNKLMVMPLGKPEEAINPSGLSTICEPVHVDSRYLAFVTTESKLHLIMAGAPHLHGGILDISGTAAPAWYGGYLYVCNTAQEIVRCRIMRPEQPTATVGKYKGQPGFWPSHNCVYCLSNVEAETTPWQWMYGYDLKSLTLQDSLNFFLSPDLLHLHTSFGGTLWFFGRGSVCYLTEETYKQQKFVGNRFIAHADPIRPSTTPFGADNYCYYVFQSNLYRIPYDLNNSKPEIDKGRELLATGCATSPDVQPGFVIYGGTDNKIYRLAL